MIEIISGGHGEGKTVEAVRRAASWLRTGGSVVFLTPTRYSASHVEQVADLIEHEVPGVRDRFTAIGVANLGEVEAKLAGLPTEGHLVVVDGASELVTRALEPLRGAGVTPGPTELLALTFAFARTIERKGYWVVVTLARD